MKNKTSKLAKLERSRKSILTNDLEKCFVCGNPAVDIHEIYGGANRKQSMRYDFCVPLCRTCHKKATYDVGFSVKLKQICQKKFEETHTRDEFLKIIGRSYEL